MYIKGYLKRECGEEVLLINRTEGKAPSKEIDYFKFTPTQGYRVLNPDGVNQSLAANGGNSGGRTFIKIDNGVDTKIQVEGNIFPSGHASGEELIKLNDKNGIACSLCGNGGGQGGKTGLYLLGGTKDNLVRTIDANYHKGISPKRQRRTHIVEKRLKLRVNTKKGYQEAKKGDGVRLDHLNSTTGRARTMSGVSNTILTGGNQGVVTEDYQIRRLTPVECERLQGFPDDWTRYGADGERISDTQRYKCCGNAVTVNVIECIMNDWNMWF